MQARIAMKRAAISVTSFLFLTGLAWDGFATPIDLENSVNVGWGDNGTSPTIWIEGAPRLVPDMSNARDLLQFVLDFHGLSVVPPNFGKPMPPSFLRLNIADADRNVVFTGKDPLQLTYSIPVSTPNPNGSGRLPATAIVVNLGSFDNVDSLPPGDLLFTVSVFASLANPFGATSPVTTPAYRNPDATLTIRGPGTVVPEPATVVLLLSGLTGVGLNAGWRRIRRRANLRIG